MRNVAVLIVRLAVGGLLAGHGAQKLFGWFGGGGIEGTSAMMESLGLKPGQRWAALAGMSEFLGGTLTMLGLLNPIGPLIGMGAMLMATVKVHAGKPIWTSQGGAELPLTNMAVQLALTIAGPGKLSLDRLFGIRLPRWVALVGFASIGATVAYASTLEPNRQARQAGGEQGAEQAGGDQQPSRDAEQVPVGAAAISDEGEPSELVAAGHEELRRGGIAATDTGGP